MRADVAARLRRSASVQRRHSGGTAGRVVPALLVLIAVAAVIVAVGAVLQDQVPSALARRLYPLRYKTEIADASGRHGVDPYLVAAVVKAESGFDPGATSGVGAVGLMQLMPDTADWIVARDDWGGAAKPDLRDPADSIELGTYYLAFLLDRFKDVSTALAAYNAGQGVVEQWLASRGTSPAAGVPTTLVPGDIPFPETQGFVERVERFRERYREIYPGTFTP